jgi:integrase
MLTLYRRHSLKNCTKNYPQNQRVFFPSGKTDRARDCACTICAEGTLTIVGLITNKSTGCTTWPEGTAVAKQWEAWGQTTPPPVANDKKKSPLYAVDSFLEMYGPKGKNNEKSTVHGMTTMLRLRLLPFCEDNHVDTIDKFFNDLDMVTRFITSWGHMRKSGELLADSSKRLLLVQLRQFGNFCLPRFDLTTNQAKDKTVSISAKTEPKFGMSQEEDDRLYAAFKARRNGWRGVARNSELLTAVYLVMRHGGLRISDAVRFHTSELVQSVDGEGWALKLANQEKTGDPVYVKLPDFVANALHHLPIRGNGYFFWDGVTGIDHVEASFTKAFQAVSDKVNKQTAFEHRVTPHTCRHTFAIYWLNQGVDMKTLSRAMGHKTTVQLDLHYSHAIKATKLAADRAFTRAA